MRQKILGLGSTLTLFSSNALAHTDNTSTHMMGEAWHGSMWGWHWTGSLFMLALWILVILGIIYLGQKILQESQGGDS